MNNMLLLILDGWGIAPPSNQNAIHLANTPQWDEWQQQAKINMALDASGETVGLPLGQMGNSEVGHMHIGAGRLVQQDLSRIDNIISNKQLGEQPNLRQMIDQVNQTNAALHLAGLVSDGGVHSHLDHLYALINLIEQHKVKHCYIHAFLDGRDTAPTNGIHYIEALQSRLNQSTIKLASISGRYFAMDRDNRWDRVHQSYQCLTEEAQCKIEDPVQFIHECYQKNITDEFIPPTATNHHMAIKNNDHLLHFNFRADRARQLCKAFVQPAFAHFKRDSSLNIHLASMTEFASDLNANVIFPPQKIENTLGECIAQNKKMQLRIAETEKYAHVTFFLNGGLETPFPLEDRVLIPSPNVATYDLKPEMSVFEVTEELVSAIKSKTYTLIVCNFANADMVGHTGDLHATISAIETLDSCFAKLDAALADTGCSMMVTADHGNAEMMFNAESQQVHTAHTTNHVPLLFISKQQTQSMEGEGSLIDIAPTILANLNLNIPPDMTGKVLFKPKEG